MGRLTCCVKIHFSYISYLQYQDDDTFEIVQAAARQKEKIVDFDKKKLKSNYGFGS